MGTSRMRLRRFKEAFYETDAAFPVSGVSERLLLENAKIRLKLALIRPWAFGEIMPIYQDRYPRNEQ